MHPTFLWGPPRRENCQQMCVADDEGGGFCPGKHDYIRSKPLSCFPSSQLLQSTKALQWPQETGTHISWVILALSLPARPARTLHSVSAALLSMTGEVHTTFSLWKLVRPVTFTKTKVQASMLPSTFSAFSWQELISQGTYSIQKKKCPLCLLCLFKVLNRRIYSNT